MKPLTESWPSGTTARPLSTRLPRPQSGISQPHPPRGVHCLRCPGGLTQPTIITGVASGRDGLRQVGADDHRRERAEVGDRDQRGHVRHAGMPPDGDLLRTLLPRWVRCAACAPSRCSSVAGPSPSPSDLIYAYDLQGLATAAINKAYAALVQGARATLGGRWGKRGHGVGGRRQGRRCGRVEISYGPVFRAGGELRNSRRSLASLVTGTLRPDKALVA